MERIEPGEMVRRLTGFIRTEGRFDSVAIENFRKMPGGASREIWSFECATERGGETSRRAMVLRRDPGAHNISSNRRHEFMVIRAAFEERIPVPEVFWVSEDPAVLGSAFFIMERIDGETLARRLLRDDAYARAREVMPAQLAEILAKIHRIDPVKHKLDFLTEPGDNAALTEVKRYEETFRLLALEPHPALESAMLFLGPKACDRSSIGSWRISAIPWRTSDGCACGHGVSAMIRNRSEGLAPARIFSTPTKKPVAPPSIPKRLDSGRSSAICAGE